MKNAVSKLADQFTEPPLAGPLQTAGKTLRALLDADAYVGEVVSLGYNEAIIQIHDFHRQRVGGIPALCFLLASRVNPQATPNVVDEDASVILLRVMDHADLPNAEEARRVRVENAQRVSGEVAVNWDDRAVMDATTHNLLSYAGVRCRVIGTFYMGNLASEENPSWQLCFGADISNYYPNRGLKVFKPKAGVLASVVNFRDPIIYGATKIPMVRYRPSSLCFHKSPIPAHFECLSFRHADRPAWSKDRAVRNDSNRKVQHNQDHSEGHLCPPVGWK